MALSFLRGKTGELRAGYHIVARLGRWKAHKGTDEAWTVEAPAEDVNSYRLNHSKLQAVLRIGIDEWKWRSVELISNGNDSISFRLSGDIEKRRGNNV